MNTITFTGGLTRAPELRYTAQGQAMLAFTLIDTPRKYNRETQTWEAQPDQAALLNCIAWETIAEGIANQCKKGDQLTVTGDLKGHRWQAQDGQDRYQLQLTVKNAATKIWPTRNNNPQGAGGSWNTPQAYAQPPAGDNSPHPNQPHAENITAPQNGWNENPPF